MAIPVTLIATIAVFLLALGLHVSALRDLKRYMPAGLPTDGMFRIVVPEHAFSSRVPRRLQQRYLLSLLLMSVAVGGAVALSLMSANYSRAVLFGFALLLSLLLNASCWRRFTKS